MFHSLIKKQNKTKMRYTVYFLDRRLFKICLKGGALIGRELLIKFGGGGRFL